MNAHKLVRAIAYWVPFSVFGWLPACSEEVSGPRPVIADRGTAAEDSLAVDPGVVCRAQLTTEVTIVGEGFSPVPIDVPNHPRIALPTLTLERASKLDGAKSAPTAVVFSGDPAVETNLELLTWQSQDELTLTVNQAIALPDGTTGELPTGIWDLVVTNPNTNVGTRTGVLAVVDEPTLEAPTPGIVCLAEGERTITLNGADLLEIEGKNGELSIEGIDEPFPIDEVGDCTEIAHDGVRAQYCKTAEVTLAEDAIEPGYPELVTRNPQTAACRSQEAVNLRVVPPPVIERVEAPLACIAQSSRSFVISGEGFLTIDGSNPAVSVGGVAVSVDAARGCKELTALGHEVERCTSLEITIEDGAVEPGTPEVVVTNPDPAGCSASNSVALTLVPPPTVTEVVPPLVCIDQGERVVEIRGTDFLVVAGVVPDVVLGTLEVDADAIVAGDCEPLTVEGLTVRRCSRLTVTIAEGQLPAGTPDVTVTNPDPAGCLDTKSGLLTVVPSPTITEAQPALICTEDASRAVTLSGNDFLEVEDELPTVTVDGTAVVVNSVADCAALAVNGLTVRRCTSLEFTIPAGALDPGTPEIVVTNPDPAGCGDSNAVALTIVPPPTVTEVVPPIVCTEQGERVVEIRGNDFLVVDGAAPEVVLGNVAASPGAVVADDCDALLVEGLSVQRCSLLTVTLAEALLPAGAPDVTVTNPDPAGCADTKSGLVTLVNGPTIADAQPALVCTDDGSRAVTVTGEGFLEVGGELPAVTIDGTAVVVDALSNCTALSVNGLTVQSCTTIDMTIPEGTLAAGDSLLEVQNPAPAGCAAVDSTVITVPPSISISSAAPGAVCSDTGVHTVTVEGEGFLVVDGTNFAVSVAGAEVTPAEITGCTDLDVNGLDVLSCTGFSFDLDSDEVPAGPVSITIQNPGPDGCALTSEAVLNVTLPPTVTSVEPDNICSNVTSSLTLTGTNFVTTTDVVVGGVTASSITLNSSTELVATFDGGLPAGTHDVTADNGIECTSTLAGALVVDPTPIVFFVKPQVLYNGITISATIFASNLSAPATELALVNESGTSIPIAQYQSDPARPNRIVAEIPAGLSPGDYEVRLTSDLGCVGGLPGAISITGTLSLALDSEQPIDPAYASPTTPTAVTVFADSEGLAFEPGVLVYLSPEAGGTATELGAVVVDEANPHQLSAVIPGGLDAGSYNLIVVNPLGEVGLAEGAVTVTSGEPPMITAVEPVSFANTENTEGTLFGANFDATAGVSAALICDNGNSYPVTLDETSLTESSVDATFPSSGLTAGLVCLVEITNLGEGASYRYSAVSVRNPAQNLFPWTDLSTEMVEARRGLGLEAARPTATSRFLYAIGGDEGSLATAKTSVEAAPVDVFGNPGTWALQRNDLPGARTLGGSARIGKFLYLVGGNDGTAVTNTLLRAEVLDPLAGPEILDLDATLGDGTTGLGGGLWLYRVAATFPSSDPNNPGGESLAGDPFSVLLPENTQGIVLSISWAEVAGANGYRVYRTPADPSVSVTDVELLAELTCGDRVCDCETDAVCRYSDDGQTETTDGETPLPAGSLGVWHSLAGSTLETAREGHATVVAPNPNPAQPNEFYLYAFGGRDDSGTLLASYEWARVTVANDGSQTVSAWTTGTRSIGDAKTGVGAWVLTTEVSSVVGDDVFVFVGTGVEAGPGTVSYSTEIRSGSLTPASTTGDLSATEADILDAENGMTNERGGSTCEVGSGFLYLFGGGQSAGTLAAADYSGGVAAGPDVSSWTALGAGSLNTARIYAASTNESAFYYVAGGSTVAAGTNATASVERTVQ